MAEGSMRTVADYRAAHTEIVRKANEAETKDERDYWLRQGDAAAMDLATVMDPDGERKMALLAVLIVGVPFALVVLFGF